MLCTEMGGYCMLCAVLHVECRDGGVLHVVCCDGGYCVFICALYSSQEVNPTCFVGVPRVWEKFKEKIELHLSQVSGFKGFVLEKSKVSVANAQYAPYASSKLLMCLCLYL